MFMTRVMSKFIHFVVSFHSKFNEYRTEEPFYFFYMHVTSVEFFSDNYPSKSCNLQFILMKLLKFSAEFTLHSYFL